jgi:glycosyltransferase involved in cell wall biosynthesis
MEYESKLPLVSIIVPVFNREQTIERCLCSIRNQTYKNFEVLMVNDGSEDHSLRILRKYQSLDSRFRLLDKEHSGVSESRNLGISQAKGEYLQFLDADDWLVKEATETFVFYAKKYDVDMVIADYYRVSGTKIRNLGSIPVQEMMTREKFAEYMMKAPANFYYGVMWNKFFRASIIKSFQLNCLETLNWCEDLWFNLRYLLYVKSVYVAKIPIYYYVKTEGSLTSSSFDVKKIVRTKKILFEQYKKLYQEFDLYDENRWKIRLFYIAIAHDGIKTAKQIS